MKLKRANQTRRFLIAHEDPKSPIAEAFRTLRTNIKFSNIDSEKQIVMTTSTGPSEGKSTVSANLAIVMAQSSKKTLLIDADLRKPSVHHTFKLLNKEGLTNILVGQANMEKVIKRSLIEGLDIITSGPIPPNPAELVGSKGMSSFLDKLRAHYDFIIVDTPPVIAVTDAQLLSNIVDGVLLVVNSGKTDIQMAKKARDLLVKANANIMGCVLNNRKIGKDNQYYYYYGN